MDYETIKHMISEEQFDAIQAMISASKAKEEEKKMAAFSAYETELAKPSNIVLRHVSGNVTVARRLTNREMSLSNKTRKQIVNYVINGADAKQKKVIMGKNGKKRKGKKTKAGRRRRGAAYMGEKRGAKGNRRMRLVKSLVGPVGEYLASRLHVKDSLAVAQAIVGDKTYGKDHVEVAQQIYQDVICTPDTDNWQYVAAVWSLLAFSQNSHVTDIATIAGVPVGVLYLAFVTILWDLHNASAGMICVFKNYPEAYIKLRTAILPKTLRDRVFSWLWPTVNHVDWNDFQDVLNHGLPMILPDGTSLSWPTGAVTATGEPILETTTPVLNILDLQQLGVQWVERIFQIVQVDADKYPLVSYPTHELATHTSAAFCFLQPGQSLDLAGVGNVNCEIPWESHCTDIAALCLSVYDENQRETKTPLRIIPGTATFSYKNDNPYFINEPIIVNPAEVSYAVFQMMYTAILLAGDLAYQHLVSRNNISQSPDSVLHMATAGQWMHYCLAFFSKKYSRCSAYMATQGALFDGSTVLFAGAQWSTFWDISAGGFFSFINDCCSNLVAFPVPASNEPFLDGYTEILVPYIGSHGLKTNVNPLVLGPGNDCTSLLHAMYPNAIITLPYSFLAALPGSYADVFDRTLLTVQFLTGQAFDDSVSAVASIFNLLQGAISEEDWGGFRDYTTLLYVTCIVEELQLDPTWDPTANLLRLEISSRHPFDPNKLSVLYNPAKICYTKFTGGEYKNWFNEMTQLPIKNTTTVAQGFCPTATRQAVDPYSTRRAEEVGGGRHESGMSLGGSIIDLVRTVGGGLLRTVVGSIMPKFFGNIARGGYIPPHYFLDHEDPHVIRGQDAARRLMFESDVPSMRPISGASSYNSRGRMVTQDSGLYLF